MNDSDARFTFIQGLHPDARLQVLYKEPTTLADAYRIAEHLETVHAIANGYRPNEPVVNPNWLSQPNRSHWENSNVTPMDLDAITRTWKKSSRPQQRSPSQVRTKGACHWCGRSGHYRRYCRDRLEAIRKMDEEHEKTKKQDFYPTQL
ncbi:uncharacterized protein BYT42DRAFT_550061 [Radiomyces spectabilis]|uniref:uncharacterized protein n=1 Tax=Radiomyces spectabilis TaxID=64574 RepID=UPI002221040D|nr:uncharacterized protein BYT42DRAFT_550061 [Radiomyces spectabilis]KAI8366101.1 hypothetical protein BYT42DRAFT_550061 [Radiomyces spectabilis]